MRNHLSSYTLSLAAIVWPMAIYGFETPTAPIQYLAQISAPPSAGGCKRGKGAQWTDECYRDVKWIAVPNSRTFVGGYDEGFTWIGSNTINRKGDKIDFDIFTLNTYSRLSANCRLRLYSITAASDSLVDPSKYQSVNDHLGRALSYACKLN